LGSRVLARLVVVCALLCAGCGSEAAPTTEGAQAPRAMEPHGVKTSETAPLSGPWRAALASPGGALPFGLEFASDGEGLVAYAINGDERVQFSTASRDEHSVALRIDAYDSEITATLSTDANAMSGKWTKTTPAGPASMSFSARRGQGPRFEGPGRAPQHAVPTSVDGDWSMVFTEKDGSTFAGRGVLTTHGRSVRGTILTDTGDYRYLDGRYTAGVLELSCFDGGHAFLFRAAADASGSLSGDFWSRGSYHAAWTATRMAPDDPSPLADPYAAVALSDTAKNGRFEFAFEDLSGTRVTDRDPRFDGKVVLVEVFGTWCPNCNDYAPLLAKWDKRYRDRGLEIVGLAFEMTGDVERDRRFVGAYARRHGLAFPLLLAGTSDKTDAAAVLPGLDRVLSYPTTVFVGRDGAVAKIHSGFSGPATGPHHTAMVSELEREIEALLGPPQ